MNESSPVAIADGIALMFWVLGVGGWLFLMVAFILEYFFEPRDRRGEFAHHAAKQRANQQLLANTNPQLTEQLAARRQMASDLAARDR